MRTSDENIRRDVENELTWEPGLVEKEILVKVQQGVVTLGGSVPHYADRWTAEQVAKRIRGVRAIANDIEVLMPKAGERSDTDIAAAAANALKWNSATESCDIKLVIVHGWIELTGEVQFAHQRDSAENTVRHLAGVKAVTNNIVVKPTTKVRDVKEKIEDALDRQANLDASAITVDVHDTEVTLNGSVRAYWERDAAERAARSAPGVSRVENEIQVRY